MGEGTFSVKTFQLVENIPFLLLSLLLQLRAIDSDRKAQINLQPK